MIEKKDYTVNGECPKDCNRCCTNVLPLSDYEINKIKKVVRRNNIQPINLNIDPSNPKYTDQCPFFNEGRCVIYVNRPEICKWFNCNKDANTHFNHRDKRLVNMLLTFFPNEVCYNAPDVEIMDLKYQTQKKEFYAIRR